VPDLPGRLSPRWLSTHRAPGRALDALLTQLGVKLDAVLSYDMPLEQVIGGCQADAPAQAARRCFTSPAAPKVRRLRQLGGRLVLREDDALSRSGCACRPTSQHRAPGDYYRSGLLVSLSPRAPERSTSVRAALSCLRR